MHVDPTQALSVELPRPDELQDFRVLGNWRRGKGT